LEVVKTARMLNVSLAALLAAFSMLGVVTPMAVATTVCGGGITPPQLSHTVAAGSTTTESWGFTWTGVTPNTAISIAIATSNLAWTVAVSPTSVDSGPSGSGSTTLTVTVTAPNTVGSSTQVKVTASNDACAIADFASGSEIFVTTPEFALPAMAVVSIAFLGLVFFRKRMAPTLK
jgi:hypothetical protein